MHCLTAFDFGDFSRLGQVVVLRKGRRSAKKRKKLRKSVTVNVHFADVTGLPLRRGGMSWSLMCADKIYLEQW